MASITPERQYAEIKRLQALSAFEQLDSPREREFDDIAALAALVCDTPTAMISLLDDRRQWFKAAVGTDVIETPRDISFCTHAIEYDGTMIVENASLDPRFATNPLVTGEMHVRFYAGAPLTTADGLALGTLCVLDTVPRSLSAAQLSALEALARQVIKQFELKRLLVQKQLDEARHRLIIDTATEYAIVTTDLAGRIDSWNEGAARMFGRGAADVLDQPCAMLFTAQDIAAGVPEREMGNALAHEHIFDERWHPRRDGSLFWGRCEVMPLRQADGRPIGFLKIMQDRTAQRVAEKDLRESETRVRLALDAAELGAWEAVPGTNEVYGDTRAKELLEYNDEGPMPFETFLGRVHEEDRQGFNEAVEGAVGAGTMDVEFRVKAQTSAPFRWLRSRAKVVKRPGERQRLVGTVRDISAEKAAEEHRVLLTNELQHRVKNTLGVVQGIVSQALRTVATPAEARDAIMNRLSTLAHAHDILTQTSWTAAPIASVVDGAVLAHLANKSRVAAFGPVIQLKARAALALSMALHELFTNAVKYGALSNECGTVTLGWTVTEQSAVEPQFELSWREQGGPTVRPPTRTGFGTRLTGSSLAGDLGGKGVVEYAADGVRWSLSTKLSAVSETRVPPER